MKKKVVKKKVKKEKHKHHFYYAGLDWGYAWGVGDETLGSGKKRAMKCSCGKTKENKPKISMNQFGL